MENKVVVITTIKGVTRINEVYSAVLASEMRIGNSVAKDLGKRPGQEIQLH